MRGESVIRPRQFKHKKDKDREIAKRAKEAMAEAVSRAVPIVECHQKKAN
jgi:hypothetical protein